MKKTTKILPIALLITLFVTLMYIFRLPPFASLEPEPEPPKLLVQEKKQPPLPPKPIKESALKSAYEIYKESMKNGADFTAKGYYSLAINEYRKAASSLPGSIEPLSRIGEIYLAQRNSEKAVKVFEEIIGMGSRDAETKTYLARAYLQNNDIDKAEKTFESIEQPNQFTTYYKAMIAAYKGDYEKSKNLFNEVLASADSAAKTNAQIFMRAFNEFSKFEGGQPSHLKTLLARTFDQAGEYSLAIPLLANVIKEKPNYRDAWIMLGYAYLNNSQPRDAVEALEQGRKLDPSKSETLFFLGLAYFTDNKLDNAINYMESALQNGFEPRIQAHQKLAEFYFIKQDYNKSAKAYETVLGLNSSNIDYFIRPIWIYIEKLNNPAAALSLAQTALVKHPDSAMAYNLIGWAYVASENYSLAEKNLRAALSLNPRLAAAYLNLGQMYEKMGYMLTAKEYYKQAFTIDKNATSIGTTAAERYNKIAQAEQEKKKQSTPPAGKVYQVNTLEQ